jgi:hypothetical protein
MLVDEPLQLFFSFDYTIKSTDEEPIDMKAIEKLKKALQFNDNLPP